MEHSQPFNFWKYVEEHIAELQPPVGNKLLYKHGEFKVMVIGGPNARTDFHWEVGPEFFYQVKGDMCLRIAHPEAEAECRVRFEDVHIREGEMYMLPPRIYHSPQRTAGSIGIVLERERRATEDLDRLTWFCQKCGTMLHQDSFHCVDLGSQLKPVILDYYQGPKDRRTCNSCGWEEEVPEQFRSA